MKFGSLYASEIAKLNQSSGAFRFLNYAMLKELCLSGCARDEFEAALRAEVKAVDLCYEELWDFFERTSEEEIQASALRGFAVLNYLALLKIQKKATKWLGECKQSTRLLNAKFCKALIRSSVFVETGRLDRARSGPASERATNPEGAARCPVCLESIGAADPAQLSCSHTFCWACLATCAASGLRSCPICRKEQSLDPALRQIQELLGSVISSTRYDPITQLDDEAQRTSKSCTQPAPRRSRVLVVANRVGTINGETGGGSIFRERLMEALQNHAGYVSCLTVGRGDHPPAHMDSARGVVMRPSLANMRLAWSQVQSKDLVIISGSWSWLNSFVVLVCLLRGVPCVNIITMDALGAARGSFTGPFRIFAMMLYFFCDVFNSAFSSGAYTRSAEMQRQFRRRGMPVKGVVFLDDQYKIFREVDTDAELAEARSVLCGAAAGGSLDRPVMLYCGRLIPEKRIELLLASRPKGMTLAIVGNGSLNEKLREAHDPAGGVVCIVGETVPQVRGLISPCPRLAKPSSRPCVVACCSGNCVASIAQPTCMCPPQTSRRSETLSMNRCFVAAL
jgi:hypothetical protein